MGGCETYLPQCEEINDCNPNPCNNVGSCVDALNNYTCFCAAGFKGRNCSVNIDECAPHPCGERGDCTDSINSFTCHCNEGYMGTLCQRQKRRTVTQTLVLNTIKYVCGRISGISPGPNFAYQTISLSPYNSVQRFLRQIKLRLLRGNTNCKTFLRVT